MVNVMQQFVVAKSTLACKPPSQRHCRERAKTLTGRSLVCALQVELSI